MHIYLKTKIMSLAAESRIIRNLEKSCKRNAVKARKKHKEEDINYFEKQRVGLYFHRINDVRSESRSSNVAYSFLKGKKYGQIEKFAYTSPDWKRIEQLVSKYSESDRRVSLQQFAEWKDEAEKYFEDSRKE